MSFATESVTKKSTLTAAYGFFCIDPYLAPIHAFRHLNAVFLQVYPVTLEEDIFRLVIDGVFIDASVCQDSSAAAFVVLITGNQHLMKAEFPAYVYALG